MPINVIAFDLIGTVLHVKPDREAMRKKLKDALENMGFKFTAQDFFKTYDHVYQRYLEIKARSLKEHSSLKILAETLTRLGYPKETDDLKIIEAGRAYYRPYLESIYITPGTKESLNRLKDSFRLGIVTNFPDQWPVLEGLKKVGLKDLFNPIIISADVGWRKPHPSIFNALIKAVEADAETIVFIGDDLKRDIYGADKVGMKTILLSTGITDTEDIFYEQKISREVNALQEIKSLTEVPDALKKLDF